VREGVRGITRGGLSRGRVMRDQPERGPVKHEGSRKLS